MLCVLHFDEVLLEGFLIYFKDVRCSAASERGISSKTICNLLSEPEVFDVSRWTAGRI